VSEAHNCNECWYGARHISSASLYFQRRFYDNVCWIRTVIERDMHVSINFNGAVDFKRMWGPSRMPACLSCYDWTLSAPGFVADLLNPCNFSSTTDGPNRQVPSKIVRVSNTLRDSSFLLTFFHNGSNFTGTSCAHHRHAQV